MIDQVRYLRARMWLVRTWTIIGLGIIAVAVWQLLHEPIGIALPPLFLAAIIVYLLNPFVRRLAARGVPRIAGTAIAYLALLGGVAIAVVLLAPLIGQQINEFLDNAPEILADLQASVNRQLRGIGVDYQFDQFDPENEELRDTFREFFGGPEGRARIAAFLAGASSVATAIFHTFLIVLLGPILAFYLLADLPHITDGLKRLLPPSHRAEVQTVAEAIGDKVGSYFRGQLLVALFVGVATAIGLRIVGLPFWALVGLLTGLFNIVPLIGPFVGGVIGVAIALTAGRGMSQAAFVILVMVIVQQVDNHVISPNIMSRTVQIHPVTVMLALLVAGTMFGILGMLVAVPAVAAGKLVALHLLATRAPWSNPDLPIPETLAEAEGDEEHEVDSEFDDDSADDEREREPVVEGS